MIIDEKNRYLVLPVSEKTAASKVYIRSGDKLLLDLDVKVDFSNPESVFYYDLKPFFGQNIDVSHISEKSFGFSEFPADVTDENRPLIHFTAKKGWINDPNGLCFYEGKYHMFFQHNPVGTCWGNMHWGHAVSYDLIDWEELEDALIPDEMGTMYSGSAIVDYDNVIGLKENEHDPLILFYTAAGRENEISRDKPYTQCMAYSTDGGNTFKKWKNNPVVPHIKGGNRDPKVIRDPESGVYVMALYLDGDEYALLTSSNLTEWKQIQSINFKGDNECPDFYPLPDENGKLKWVLNGAHDCAMVGDFDPEKGFYNCGEVHKFGFARPYAAQSFNLGYDLRRIRIAWNTYTAIPSKNFNCEMGMPYDVSLKNGRVNVTPIPELDNHFTKTETYEALPSHGISMEMPLPCKLDFEFSKSEENIIINIFNNEVKIDAAGTLTVNDADQMLLNVTDGVRFCLIADKCGIEIFDGSGCAYGAFVADIRGDMMTVSGEGSLDKLIVRTLK